MFSAKFVGIFLLVLFVLIFFKIVIFMFSIALSIAITLTKLGFIAFFIATIFYLFSAYKKDK